MEQLRKALAKAGVKQEIVASPDDHVSARMLTPRPIVSCHFFLFACGTCHCISLCYLDKCNGCSCERQNLSVWHTLHFPSTKGYALPYIGLITSCRRASSC